MRKYGQFTLCSCLAFLCQTWVLVAQVTLAFQGAEPGDNWPYTITGSSAVALTESQSPANIVSGTQSLVSGGLSGGGSCISGGTGNGTSTVNSIVFESIDISSSNMFTRELTFHFGNRFPSCNGTGYDTGENLSFTPILDGVNQTSTIIFTGAGNAAVDIHQSVYTYSIPPCVNSFGFRLQISLNRNDEMLFVDDVRITSPELNAAIPMVDSILGPPQVCLGSTSVYSSAESGSIQYNWFGLPSSALLVSPSDSLNRDSLTVDWGNTPVGTYLLSLVATDLCGFVLGDTISLYIELVEGGDTLEIIGADTICEGTSVSWTSNYESGNLWSTNETTQSINISETGIYSLSIEGACGLSQVFKTLTVLPLPIAVITANGSLEICPGQSVTLSSNTDQGVVWTGSITAEEITVEAPGEYILSVSNSCGTTADTVEVIELPGLIVPSILAASNVLCNGSSLVLYSDQEGGNMWSTGSTGDSVLIDNPGEYIVYYSNSCATGSDTFTVSNSSFSVDIISTPEMGYAPLLVNLSLNANSSVTTQLWDIANLAESTMEQPEYTFEEEGAYLVSVLATDSNGCTSIDTVLIDVLPELISDLNLPNCFTPNGDGFNDFFKASSTNLTDFNLEIYNRWGGLVYRSFSNSPGWDGNSNTSNMALPDGVYFYILKATGNDGKKYNLSGSVTLLR